MRESGSDSDSAASKNSSADALHTILVPLDGSPLAESALPMAVQIARATGGALLLAHVISNLTWAFAAETGLTSAEAYEELLAIENRGAREYLQRMVSSVPAEVGVRVEGTQVRGEPAPALIDMIEELDVDLVVMTTHGYTGLRRFALGSVADRVARSGTAPVLLLRSFEQPQGNDQLERALIPLDGSTLAESALEVADQLVGMVIRQVTLLRAVTPAGAAAAEIRSAEQYLRSTSERPRTRWQARGCDVTELVVRGQPGPCIVREAARTGALIILATRGQTGWTRWTLGSVADRVLEGAQSALLLVNPRVTQTHREA